LTGSNNQKLAVFSTFILVIYIVKGKMKRYWIGWKRGVFANSTSKIQDSVKRFDERVCVAL